MLNEFLNAVVVETNPRNPQTAGSRVEVHYKRRREMDRYFELPPHLQDRLPPCVRSLIPARHTVKARVTYDQKTGAVLAKIVKARVADLEMHMPGCAVDCRISVNLEMDWDGPVEELEALEAPGAKMPDRKKDRISYTQGPYQVDLTQVTQSFTGVGVSFLFLFVVCFPTRWVRLISLLCCFLYPALCCVSLFALCCTACLFWCSGGLFDSLCTLRVYCYSAGGFRPSFCAWSIVGKMG